MDIRSALTKVGLARVAFSRGSICRLRDDLIIFPDDEENRQEHDYRTVLVLSNGDLCTRIDMPLVTIAPMSTKMRWKNRTELVIDPTNKNGLALPSRVMLAHIQPILKTHIEKKFGELDEQDWDRVMEQIVVNFDHDAPASIK